ncbi:hypothetical protein NYE22_21545 [Bacillus sp. FSL K6-1560]|uniref:hypothetical protein n=1 Tax=Bacillus sp. FSL K6-1560 TaxID=2975293 RepID=UPI00315987BE
METTVPTLLFKFIDKENLSDFINDGNLFFKNTGYFIDLEEKYGDTIFGDKYEGTHFLHFDPKRHSLFIEYEGKRIPIEFESGYSTKKYESVKDFQLTCFVAPDLEDFISEDNKTFFFKNSVIEELKREFKDRAVIIIHNPEGFIGALKESAQKINLGFKYGKVNYFDPRSETPLDYKEFEKDIAKAFFNKRKTYQYQREFRIVTQQPIKKDYIKIHIRNIKDYVTLINDIDALKTDFSMIIDTL